MDTNNTNSGDYYLFGSMGAVFYDGDIMIDDTYPVKVVLSISLAISMFLSVIGNTCTLAVIVRNRSMRTPTNCYLANLAITDLLIVLFIPMDIYLIWLPNFYPLGDIGCRLHFLLWDCLSQCSLLIITAFTVERYIVVKKPFLRQKLALKSRVYKIVAVLWLVSISLCIPEIYYIDLLERKKYVFCYFSLPDMRNSVLFAIETLVFFVFPMTTIVILYILISIELKSMQSKLRSSSSPRNGKQNTDKAVKMLVAVAASFIFFWSPYFVLRVMMIHPNFKYEDNFNLWKIVNYLCYNGYMSAAANPILYSLMSRKFRQAFKDLLKGRRTSSNKRNSIYSIQFGSRIDRNIATSYL